MALHINYLSGKLDGLVEMNYVLYTAVRTAQMVSFSLGCGKKLRGMDEGVKLTCRQPE